MKLSKLGKFIGKIISSFVHPLPPEDVDFEINWERDVKNHPWKDLYHWLIILPWTSFYLVISFIYLIINSLFALAYLTTGDGIANATPGSFKDFFFFSVQTMSTVGYGSMYPESLLAQIIVTLEVLSGLLLLTVVTGLMFNRFSKPTAKLIFSKYAVICNYNGLPTLMFRTANQRNNRILEAQIKASILLLETSQEGHQINRFYDLKLVRSQTPFFRLSWLVMHPIDQNSPLYRATPETFKDAKETHIFVILTGLDETTSQNIHARYSYPISHILWNKKLVDIFNRNPNGKIIIEYKYFHDVIPEDQY